MKPIKIIKSYIWKHPNGRTASIYGAVPYFGDKGQWEIVEVGYTTFNENGTIGCGRIPFKTLDEAIAKYPNIPVDIN